MVGGVGGVIRDRGEWISRKGGSGEWMPYDAHHGIISNECMLTIVSFRMSACSPWYHFE